MTTADRIAQKFHDVRPTFADAFHADQYSIVRMVKTPDGYGGYTEVPETVESGRCSLDEVQGGTVEIAGTVMTASGVYTVELPIDTDLAADDTLTVNGREFTVMEDPKRGGEWALFTHVTVEERK